MDPILGQTISHFRILARLGGGRWGAVYKAEDTLLERQVAIRLLPDVTDRDDLTRFAAQAKAVSALKHPHVAETYEVCEWESQPLIIRELLDGDSLRRRMNQRPLSFPEVLDIGAQMADALEAAHRAGFFHGDFRPENVFLNRRGEIKVQDFGLARLTPGVTATSANIGPQSATAAYFSPEQHRGDPIYARSDIFSLGAVLYEIAAQRPAFVCQNADDCGKAVLSLTPPPPSQFNSEVPSRFDEIVAKAMEKDLDLRYQTAAEVRTDLRRLRRDWEADRIAVTRAALVEPSATPAGEAKQHAKSASPVPSATATPPEAGAPRRWMWIAAGLLLAAALGAFAVRYLHRPESRLPTVFRKLTFRRGVISSAQFSADGSQVFYTADWNGAAPDVYSIRPSSRHSHPLVGGQSAILSVSSKGELAELRQPHISEDGRMIGELAVVPPGGGAPRAVLSNIEGADWAPDGSGLAMVRRVGDFDRLEYPPGVVLRQTTGWISDPRFSPKGNQIAYLFHPVQGNDAGSVELVNLSGKHRILSRDWKSVRGLAWSPRDDEIWFTASRTSALQLYAVSLNGRPRQVGAIAGSVILGDIAPDGRALLIRDDLEQGLVAVALGQTGARDLSWVDRSVVRGLSADGKRALVEVAGAAGEQSDSIYLRDIDGSGEVRVGEGEALALALDGKRVLAQEPDSDNQLVLLPVGGGDVVRLPPSAVTHEWAAWLPDGNRFVFLGNAPGRRRQLFVQEVSGGQVRAVSPEGVGGFAALSPGGKRVAAIGPDGKGHLYPVDGGVVPTIPGLDATDRPLDWSQDGRTLFVAEGIVPADVYRLDLETGVKKLLWQLVPADRAGVTAITGIEVTPDGKLCVYSYSRTLSTLYLVEGLD